MDRPRPGSQNSSHPLRMMAPDYDHREREGGQECCETRHSGSRGVSHKGKGKGFKGKGSREDVGLDKYMLPEMFDDPWMGLYAGLSAESRQKVCGHLSDSERALVESFSDSGRLSQIPASFKKLNINNTELPTWLSHPRPLKSYAIFEPFPCNDYRKIQKLANAIHGKVYLYEHLPTRRQVVVKKMSTSNVIAFTPGLLEDALTEIGVTKYITDFTQVDYVNKMVGLYQDEEYTYFVTEFSSGGELFEHVVQAKSLSEPLARKYTKEVLMAVKSLHRNGIVHRDVSLENTLLHSDGSIRIIDFGQSVHLLSPRGPFSNSALLHTGKAGKAYYRAPEMYAGEYEGPPVDAFAIGVMLFIMTVGTPPWNSAIATDPRFKYIEKHGVSKLLLSWGKAQNMSPELLDLIERLMNPNPAKRITVDGALTHPWITGGGDDLMKPSTLVGAPSVVSKS